MSSPITYGSPCCQIVPNTIALSKRISWCVSQQNVCSALCGPFSENSCIAETLTSTCRCSNGVEPKTSDYQGSLGSLMCAEWKALCITGAAGDLQRQKQCQAESCGSKEPTSVLLPAVSATTRTSTSTRVPVSSPLTGLPTPAVTTTSTTTTSTGLTSTSDTTSFPNPNQTTDAVKLKGPTGSASPSPGGLSAGAKAGIGIGAALGVILILVGIFFLLRRAKKRKAQNPESASLFDGPYKNQAGLEVDPTNGGAETAFLASRSVVPYKMELEDNSQNRNNTLPEMPGNSPHPPHHPQTPQELDNNNSNNAYHHNYNHYHDMPVPGPYLPSQQPPVWSPSNRSLVELPLHSSTPHPQLDSQSAVALPPHDAPSAPAPAYSPMASPTPHTVASPPMGYSSSPPALDRPSSGRGSWPGTTTQTGGGGGGGAGGVPASASGMGLGNEMERLEEDERRLNEEIAEIERLRRLRDEREALRERIKMARG